MNAFYRFFYFFGVLSSICICYCLVEMLLCFLGSGLGLGLGLDLDLDLGSMGFGCFFVLPKFFLADFLAEFEPFCFGVFDFSVVSI